MTILEEMNVNKAIAEVMERTEKKIEYLNSIDYGEYNGAPIDLYARIINHSMNNIWLCQTREEVLSYEEEYINDYYNRALEEMKR